MMRKELFKSGMRHLKVVNQNMNWRELSEGHGRD